MFRYVFICFNIIWNSFSKEQFILIRAAARNNKNHAGEKLKPPASPTSNYRDSLCEPALSGLQDGRRAADLRVDAGTNRSIGAPN
jgi:hypothetical protein